jgi:hypothetical protein
MLIMDRQISSHNTDGHKYVLDLLTRRLNSQLRHAGFDPASSVLLDSRLRGNDELRVFIRRSNMLSPD